MIPLFPQEPNSFAFIKERKKHTIFVTQVLLLQFKLATALLGSRKTGSISMCWLGHESLKHIKNCHMELGNHTRDFKTTFSIKNHMIMCILVFSHLYVVYILYSPTMSCSIVSENISIQTISHM